MCVESQSEEPIKHANGVSDEVSHMIQRSKDRLTLKNLRLTERYIKGELEILVLLSFIGAGGEIHDFIASHKAETSGVKPEQRPILGKHINPPIIRSELSSDYESVLIDDIQTVKMPKGQVSSMTRLYVADEFFSVYAHTLYFSLREGRCVLLGGVTNRKISVSGRFVPIRPHQLKRQMVESTPNVMDCITSNERNFQGNGIDTFHEESCVSNLGYRVRLYPDGVWLCFNEITNSQIEISDVFFGPFDF